jgi:hypothetical protein
VLAAELRGIAGLPPAPAAVAVVVLATAGSPSDKGQSGKTTPEARTRTGKELMPVLAAEVHRPKAPSNTQRLAT